VYVENMLDGEARLGCGRSVKQ